MATLDVLSSAEAIEAISSPGVSSTKLAKVVTAVSLRLDEAVGPIVRRTITGETRVGVAGCRTIELSRWPVVSISSLVEYDESGSSTTLTAETPSTKPSDGFRLTPTTAEPELGLYRPLVERRSSGRPDTFEETVVATYVAGRFVNTAGVDERYKEAARIVLVNVWQRVLTGTITFDDAEVPRYPFPRFAIPRSAFELLRDVWHELDAAGAPLPGFG